MRVCHAEEVRECCAKVRAVDIALVLGSRVVELATFGTENLNGAHPLNIRLADGEAWLSLAQDAGASPEIDILEFVEHGIHATRRDNVPRVDEAIEHLRGRLDDPMLLIGKHFIYSHHHRHHIFFLPKRERESTHTYTHISQFKVRLGKENRSAASRAYGAADRVRSVKEKTWIG